MTDASGYKSMYIGRQDVQGPAMRKIAIASDTNTASQVDNKKWYAALVKYRALLDKIHERLLKD